MPLELSRDGWCKLAGQSQTEAEWEASGCCVTCGQSYEASGGFAEGRPHWDRNQRSEQHTGRDLG